MSNDGTANTMATTPAGEMAAVDSRRFVLAHLSDPHLPSPLSAPPWALSNKRLFGFLSWQLRRRRIHRIEVLQALKSDLDRQAADHLVVTGDIVNIALPNEFAAARRWLDTLGSPEVVTIVPGNHDAYVAVPWVRSLAQWGAFMCGDGQDDASPDGFPFVRRRGPLALIGLSTSAPTAPALASGTLGWRQIDAMSECLDRLKAEGRFRVLLIHHPPQPSTGARRKQLTDAEAFRKAVSEVGAELVLHGHDHRFRFAELDGRDGPVPVFGVTSASALPKPERPGASYHLYAIERGLDGWTLELSIRRFDPASGRFAAAEERALSLPRRASEPVALPAQ